MCGEKGLLALQVHAAIHHHQEVKARTQAAICITPIVKDRD